MQKLCKCTEIFGKTDAVGAEFCVILLNSNNCFDLALLILFYCIILSLLLSHTPVILGIPSLRIQISLQQHTVPNGEEIRFAVLN